MKKFFLLGIVFGISFCASAQLVNGSLDTNFNGWQLIGTGTSDTSAIGGNGPQPMMATGFGPWVHPQSGMTMAQIVSGGTTSISAMETFANVPAGTIQNVQTFPATFGGAIKQKFYGVANSVITFEAIFSTIDGTYASDTNQWAVNNFIYDDFGFFSVSSSTTHYAQKIGDFKLMQIDSTYLGGPHFVNGHFVYNNWRVYSYTLPATDTFTLTIGVMNCGDNLFNSDLLVDNVILTGPTSIGENENQDEGISVFPNPANESIFISAKNEKNVFELFSLEGKLVKSEELERNEKVEINISDLPEGIYSYKISGSATESGKIVVTH